jgi:ATP-binding cassette subfamily B protein
MSAFAISQSLRNAIMLVGAVSMMMISSPTLAVLVLVAIPAIVLPLFALGRLVRRLSRRAADRSSETLAYAAENLAAVRTMKAFSQEATIGQRFADADRHALEATLHRLIARSVLTGLALALVATAVVVILWWGSRLVAEGTMTTGLLGQFMLYTVLAGGAFAELAEILGELNQGSAAAARIQQVLAVEPTIRSPASPAPMPKTGSGTISFDKVSFAYPSRTDVPVLDQVSFSIREGERVALVGPSGAGKSTIFALLLRFYDPTGGTVVVDGVAANRADLSELRQRMALVPQDLALFAASVSENIRYGSPSATPEQVVEAAKKAQAHGFIEALPRGYEARLGERGLTLSGGQRQRIAIARAILRDAPILLLDEATSALDSENERDVQIALDEVMRGRTTLIIAHRLSTIQKTDRILVFDHGRLVEQGTHSELLARNGRYCRLAELQFDRVPEAAA